MGRAAVLGQGSTARGTRKLRKNFLLAGVTALSFLGASNVAYAQCVATGAAGGTFYEDLAASAIAASNSISSVLSTVNTAFLTQSTAFVSAPGNPKPDQQGGGIWARGIGGRIDVESTGVATNLTAAGAPVPGGVTCATEVRQEFAGFQVGADIARLNFSGSGTNIHFGVTAGYAESEARDISPGGTFRGDFRVPFAGLYAALTQGNFFADAQLRFDFFSNTLTDTNIGLISRESDAKSISLTANIGYRWDLAQGWFLEPSLGVIASKTNVDPILTPGTTPTVGGGGIVAPAVIQISEIESVLGRASLRVGTNFVHNNIAWQPFFTASIFHEFADDIESSFREDPASAAALPGFAAFSADITSDRIGTYGQFALGIAGQIINTGWLGYIRGDYRVGENIEGFSLNGGLRYQFTPEYVAASAPMYTKGPVLKARPTVAALHNWTGFYIGGHAGGIYGDSDWNFVVLGLPTSPEYGGVLAGGQIGYNHQIGTWVFGIEADGSWSNAGGGAACPSVPGIAGVAFILNCEDELDSFFTVRGRLGYAWDRMLFFATGGFAAGEVNSQIFGQLATTSTLIAESDRTATGWTVGGGIEFALTQNWSAKGEYLYYDLGTERHVIGGVDIDVDRTGGIGRVGLNYRFAPMAAAVVAKY